MEYSDRSYYICNCCVLLDLKYFYVSKLSNEDYSLINNTNVCLVYVS